MPKYLIPGLVLMGLFGCNESTGPSETYRSLISVISTSSNSVIAEFDLIDVDCEKLLISPDGSSLYISGYYGGDVAQLNSSTGAITGLLAFDCPTDIALSESGTKLYVLTHQSLFVVSTVSMKVIDSIEFGLGFSWEMNMRPGTDLLYISRSSDFLLGTLVVDADQLEIADTLVFNREYGGLFSPDGEAMFMGEGMNLLTLDPDNGQQLSSVVLPGYVQEVCFNSSSGMIYVATAENLEVMAGEVSEIDSNTFVLQRSAEMPGFAASMCCIESLECLYVMGTDDWDIQILDLNLFQVVGEIEIEKYLRGFARSSDENFVYCPVFFQDDSGG